MILFFVYFFGGLECVGHSFAYVADLWFLRDVWIRTQSTAVASWRAIDLSTHPSNLATHSSRLSHPSLWLSHPSLLLSHHLSAAVLCKFFAHFITLPNGSLFKGTIASKYINTSPYQSKPLMSGGESAYVWQCLNLEKSLDACDYPHDNMICCLFTWPATDSPGCRPSGVGVSHERLLNLQPIRR